MSIQVGNEYNGIPLGNDTGSDGGSGVLVEYVTELPNPGEEGVEYRVPVLDDQQQIIAYKEYYWIESESRYEEYGHIPADLVSWGSIQGTLSDQTDLNTALGDKQDTLVSGTNIKTINSNSVLGSGDISVQESLVSGTNIKTINSTSVLGSGDISVQETLVSGTNIKTINGTPLLGSGDISLQTGGSWGAISGNIEDQTDLITALTGKQDTLISGTNIKTINNTSLLGGGNIDTQTVTSGNGINIDIEDNSVDLIQQDVAATEKYIWNALTLSGTVRNNDQVLTGFDYLTSYATSSITSNNATQSFEVQWKFRYTGTATGHGFGLFNRQGTSSSSVSCFNMFVSHNSSGNHTLRAVVGNYNWTVLRADLKTTITADADYIVNVKWDGTTITGKLIDSNGNTITLTNSGTALSSPVRIADTSVDNGISIGRRFLASGSSYNAYYWHGSIDLNESFVKINGVLQNITQTGFPAQIVAKATNNLYGLVKPDGTTIIANNGVISSSSTGGTWGAISGTLSDQTDLSNALADKQDVFISNVPLYMGRAMISPEVTPTASDSYYTYSAGTSNNSSAITGRTATYVDGHPYNSINRIPFEFDKVYLLKGTSSTTTQLNSMLYTRLASYNQDLDKFVPIAGVITDYTDGSGYIQKIDLDADGDAVANSTTNPVQSVSYSFFGTNVTRLVSSSWVLLQKKRLPNGKIKLVCYHGFTISVGMYPNVASRLVIQDQTDNNEVTDLLEKCTSIIAMNANSNSQNLYGSGDSAVYYYNFSGDLENVTDIAELGTRQQYTVGSPAVYGPYGLNIGYDNSTIQVDTDNNLYVPKATSASLGVVKSDESTIHVDSTGNISTLNRVGSTDITDMVKCTQAAYDALVAGGTVDPHTFYIIVPATV